MWPLAAMSAESPLMHLVPAVYSEKKQKPNSTADSQTGISTPTHTLFRPS
jgi:hypothetical protein